MKTWNRMIKDGWNNAREIKPSKYNTVNVCLKDGRYTNSFNYIHEVQNFYFAITNKELNIQL